MLTLPDAVRTFASLLNSKAAVCDYAVCSASNAANNTRVLLQYLNMSILASITAGVLMVISQCHNSQAISQIEVFLSDTLKGPACTDLCCFMHGFASA